MSGGEPLQQPEALQDLLERLAWTPLSRLVFSGYTFEEVIGLPFGPAILRHVDVLVAGRYVASQRTGHNLIGSANQQIHLLTDRYTQADLTAVPPRELVLHRDGTVSVSGISPWRPSGSRQSPTPVEGPSEIRITPRPSPQPLNRFHIAVSGRDALHSFLSSRPRRNSSSTPSYSVCTRLLQP